MTKKILLESALCRSGLFYLRCPTLKILILLLM